MNKFTVVTGVLFAVLLLLFPSKAHAADLTITCDAENCSSSGGSLFNYKKIAPGFSVTKSVQVDNSDNPDSCSLHLQAVRNGVKQDHDLGDKILLTIERGGTKFEDTMSDLFGQNVFLGTINAGSKAEYTWTANFMRDSGNNYQGSFLGFNFDLNFECGTAPEGNEGNNGNNNNSNNNNGNTSNNRGVGGVLQMVFGDLILGESTEETDDSVQPDAASDSRGPNGNVLGVECENTYPWWLILLAQGILSLFTVLFSLLKQMLGKLWLVPIMLGVVSQLVHSYLGCGCSTGHWCERYIILNLIIMLISLGGYSLFARTRSA